MSVMDSFKLTDRVAIVTGAAQGLGEAMAQALAEAGADIVIADINEDLARSTAQRLSNVTGRQCIAIRTDVTDEPDVDAMVKATLDRFGKIDILVNNAGIVKHIPAEEMSLKDWDDVINLNLTAVFLCSQRVGRHMIQRKRGCIINISSMSGLIVNNPQPQVSYNASKAGVIMITRSLAAEWAKYGIRVNAIAPGYMETAMTRELLKTEMAIKNWIGMTPMNRPGQPSELGGAVVYLASDASSFTTGHILVVDGGYTIW
ncbi:MAG TPA: glucose 1-dehydrogenase [Firmicutes bacterium]|nr:glucose 1-dehydrogenase [Bacillota bacterium]